MKKSLILFLCMLWTGLVGIGEVSAQLNKHHFYYKGRGFIMEHNYRSAIEMLNMLLASVPDDYEGYFLRGVAKYNLDDLIGAEADFSSAIGENPVYTQAYQYRGITRSKLGNYNDALKDFQYAAELRPSASSTYFSRGVTHFLSQQFENAVEDFSRYLRSNPKDISALTNRGTCYLYLADTTNAYADFNRAIDINPHEPDGYVRRGLLEVAEGKYPEGITDLSKALEMDQTLAVAHFYRAVAYVNETKPLDALADFDRTIEIDSTNSVAYFNRAILRSQIGDFNRSIDDYDKVAEYNPGNVLVFYNRASVKAQIGDFRGAIADYTRAIELYPDFANAYFYRSQLKAELGDMRGSERDWRTGEAKVNAYRNNLKDTSYSIYADTSMQFDKLMAFDDDFGKNELKSIVGDARSTNKILPMFRVSLVARDSVHIFNPRDYRNARLDGYLQGLGAVSEHTAWDLTDRKEGRSFPKDSVTKWDEENREPVSWADNMKKGATQMLLNQYASALSYFHRASRVESDNPLVYLNQSVAQTEMIEFVASLEENRNMRQIAIGSEDDPASYLIQQNQEKRVYDYNEALADARKAIELMPELPHAYYNLGNLLCLNGDMPGAYEQYTKAIELFPYFAEAYYNRGLVQIYLKDTQTGCFDLSKAGELGLEEAYEMLKQYCLKAK